MSEIEATALRVDIQLTDALRRSSLAGNELIVAAVMLRLAVRWWRDMLAVTPEAQRVTLGRAGVDGLAGADEFLFSLLEPTVVSANRLLTSSLGVAALLMWEPNASLRLDGPPVAPVDGVGVHRMGMLGVAGLPWLPPAGDEVTVSTVRWVDKLDGVPTVGGETGPLGLARGIAAWYWGQAKAKRPVCEHGVIHHPGEVDGCDGRNGRWAGCDGCAPCGQRSAEPAASPTAPAVVDVLTKPLVVDVPRIQLPAPASPAVPARQLSLFDAGGR